MRKHHAHLSDEALVALVARGDEDALAELYDRVSRIAYGLALRVLRDERHAEDAVQEAFLQVWRSAATFRAERAKASTWILTLVHRRAVDLVRREERRQAEPLTDDSALGAGAGADGGGGLAALRARARAGRRSSSCPTSSARRSSSRTTAASRSPSSPSGSAYRSARSRAGCSPGSRACASSSTTRHRKDHGNRNSRADRRLRARRARPRRARAPTRRTSPGCEHCQQELASFWDDDRGARRRGVRARRRAPRCASASSRTSARSRRRTSSRSSRAGAALAPVLGAVAAVAAVVALAIGLWASQSLERARRDARGARARSRPQRPSSPTRTRVPSRSRQARVVSSSTPTARPCSCSTASIPRPPGRPTRCGSCRVAASRTRAPPASSRTGRQRTSSRSTARSQAGDVVAVTVENAGGVDAPTTAADRRPRTPSEPSLCGRFGLRRS